MMTTTLATATLDDVCVWLTERARRGEHVAGTRYSSTACPLALFAADVCKQTVRIYPRKDRTAPAREGYGYYVDEHGDAHALADDLNDFGYAIDGDIVMQRNGRNVATLDALLLATTLREGVR